MIATEKLKKRRYLILWLLCCAIQLTFLRPAFSQSYERKFSVCFEEITEARSLRLRKALLIVKGDINRKLAAQIAPNVEVYKRTMTRLDNNIKALLHGGILHYSVGSEKKNYLSPSLSSFEEEVNESVLLLSTLLINNAKDLDRLNKPDNIYVGLAADSLATVLLNYFPKYNNLKKQLNHYRNAAQTKANRKAYIDYKIAHKNTKFVISSLYQTLEALNQREIVSSLFVNMVMVEANNIEPMVSSMGYAALIQF